MCREEGRGQKVRENRPVSLSLSALPLVSFRTGVRPFFPSFQATVKFD